MKHSEVKYKFLFAAGGTGGHLFPAIAVAEKIKELLPESEIMFVGTKNKIESKVVPELGYKFKTIWISGFSRSLTLKNLLFPLKVLVAGIQSLMINLKYKTNVVIGAGAYVAAPVVWASSTLGAKVILLEQNSYPGVTNRLLDKRADEIHLSFEESKKYFRNEKTFLSGNPVRVNLKKIDKNEAIKKMNFSEDHKTVFILGGSLGAKSLNVAVEKSLPELEENNIQLIWQTGKFYYENYKKHNSNTVRVCDFIDDMSAAYSAADIIVARAGATTIAELASLGAAAIFVPSPNVTANHQYKNAEALVNSDAAMIIEDKHISERLASEVIETINNTDRLLELSNNIKKFANNGAAKIIAEHAINLAQVR